MSKDALTHISSEIYKHKNKIISFFNNDETSLDKFTKFFLFEVRRIPKLWGCNLPSIMESFFKCGQLGLDPSNGKVWLLPFKGECKAIIGYQGWLTLLWKSPKIKNIYTYAVYAEDKFKVVLGENLSIIHEPKLNASGTLIATYAVVKLLNGELQLHVSDKREIEKSRSSSPSGNADTSPWNTHYDQMAQTVPLKKLAKVLALHIADIESPNVVSGFNENDKVDNFKDISTDIIDAQILRDEELAIRNGA